MAYTNVWSTTLPNGSEAASSIASLIDAVRIDVGDRIADIFGIPDMTVDPLRPYNIKFTDVQSSVINLGDNAGTPRTLNINNKANLATYFAINSTVAQFNVALVAGPGLTVTGTAALLSGNSALIDQASGVARFTGIGPNGVTKGQIQLNVSDNAGGTIVAAAISNTGLMTLSSGLTVSAGTTALQALTVTSITASNNINSTITGPVFFATSATTAARWVQFDNNGGSGIFGVEQSTGSAIITGAVGYDASIRSQNGISFSANNGVSVQARLTPAGLLTISNGLTVSAGTTTVQALTATTIVASNTITSTVINAALVASGVTTSARWLEIANTSGDAIFGVESSTGGVLVTGATGYDTVVRGNSGICFSANGGTLHGRMSSAGLLTLNNGLTVAAGSTSLQALTATSVILSSNLTLASAQSIFWTSRSSLQSPSDGILTLFNNAQTDFSRLQFGGTTASFPALRRTLATLDVILADASLWATLNVGTLVTQSSGITSAGNITITTGGITVSSGTSALQAVTATTVSLSSTLTLGTANYLQGSSTSVGIAATTIYTHSGGGVDHIIVTGVDGSGNNFCDLIAFDGTNFARNVINNLAAPATRAYTVAASALKLAMSAGTYTVKTAPLQVT